MRVSETFNLGLGQASLPFVDVDLTTDDVLFVDPAALREVGDDWSRECVALLQNYFNRVLELLRAGKIGSARTLLRQLSEPNETHLGFSRKKSQGSGLGTDLAKDVAMSLSRSDAVQTGLLQDLEDTILLIPGIADDRISDMTTNIIREPLISFTQDMCTQFGIPLTPGFYVGPEWNPTSQSWIQRGSALPVSKGRPFLLVPKDIVRIRMAYRPSEYFTYVILPDLKEKEIGAGTALVQTLKSGENVVYRYQIEDKYGKPNKELLAELTQKNPEYLNSYRDYRRRHRKGALTNSELPSAAGEVIDWDSLLNNVLSCPKGRANAFVYQRAVYALLGALFSPALSRARYEESINGNSKRIDIRFTNSAVTGLFARIADRHAVPAATVVVECKNYSSTPSNPAVDQLLGRFSEDRGKFGIMLYRTGNAEKIMSLCKHARADRKGWIIPVSDLNLKSLVSERKINPDSVEYDAMATLFDEVIS